MVSLKNEAKQDFKQRNALFCLFCSYPFCVLEYESQAQLPLPVPEQLSCLDLVQRGLQMDRAPPSLKAFAVSSAPYVLHNDGASAFRVIK